MCPAWCAALPYHDHGFSIITTSGLKNGVHPGTRTPAHPACRYAARARAIKNNLRLNNQMTLEVGAMGGGWRALACCGGLLSGMGPC